jgi:hypothetical protein
MMMMMLRYLYYNAQTLLSTGMNVLSKSNFLYYVYINNYITKLRGFSPQANYTDRAAAACQRS